MRYLSPSENRGCLPCSVHVSGCARRLQTSSIYLSDDFFDGSTFAAEHADSRWVVQIKGNISIDGGLVCRQQRLSTLCPSLSQYCGKDVALFLASFVFIGFSFVATGPRSKRPAFLKETSFRNKASSVCFANSADNLPPSEMCSAKSTVLVLLTWCVSKFVHLLIQTNKQVQWKIGVCHTLARRRKEFTTPVSAGSTNCVRCSEVDCWNRIVEILLFWFLIQARKLWMKQEPKRLDMNVCACVSTMVCVCRCTCVLLSFMGNNFDVINFL